ncbi:MAG: hypothetical protein ACYCU0_14225 [Solirubrobacteraceae bacterium]
MPLEADATRWWDDPDLVAVRRRIELRREREGDGDASPSGSAPAPRARRRGVREVRGVARLALTGPEAAPSARPVAEPAQSSRRRPRPRPIERLGPRPDMIAAWAVVLGIVLLLLAILTSHG